MAATLKRSRTEAVIEDLQFLWRAGETPENALRRLNAAGTTRATNRKRLAQTITERARRLNIDLPEGFTAWLHRGADTKEND